MVEPSQAEAFILVGGEGRRLGGCDKGLIEVDGSPIIQRVVTLLLGRCAQITLLGPPKETRGYAERRAKYLSAIPSEALSAGRVSWSPDIDSHLGPGALRALQSAFHYAQRPWLWVVAADLPLLGERELIDLTHAISPTQLAHLYEMNGRLQPLVSLWSAAARVELDSLWQSPTSLQSLRGAAWVKVSTPARPASLMNLNTPEDLELLQSQLGR